MAVETVSGLMKMKQLSQAAGLPVSTIKFYMVRGLLPLPRKEKRNVAYYDEAFLKRLQIIKRMRSEGISIKNIGEILSNYSFLEIADWENFRSRAREKGPNELGAAEKLAALSDEERRVAQIREAASAVFSRKGYHTTTMDDIAAEAGVSKGTCYQYFTGKEEVFIATMEVALKELLEEASREAAKSDDILERLAIKGMTFISRYQDLHFIIMGVVSEAMGGNQRLKAKGDEFFREAAVFLAADIEEGIEQGILRPVDPIRLAYSLIGIGQVAGNLSVVQEDFSAPYFFRGAVDFIRSGLAPRPKRA